ncbi:hypothetical protein EAJ07_03750 [Bacteroides ovatus]|nr:hypothetical protein DWV98_05850 [Bacteroides ovatus]RYT75550.1 hypothetical protein EAJ07_03750 [Bacteroides ovatus]
MFKTTISPKELSAKSYIQKTIFRRFHKKDGLELGRGHWKSPFKPLSLSFLFSVGIIIKRD